MWDWELFGTLFWGHICLVFSGFGPTSIKTTITLVRNGPDLSMFDLMFLLPHFISPSFTLDINSGQVEKNSCLQEDELT